jgi:import inner membrane translocase subunit TIM10
MNFGQSQNPAHNPQVRQAKAELEGVTEMFNNMMDSCFLKCMHQYKDGDLQVGEMSCTDRCVGKYTKVNEMVGKELQEYQQKQQAAGGGGNGQTVMPASGPM